MNAVQNHPNITAGTVAGLILAGWKVVVDQGMLSFLTPEAQDSLGIFVALLVPIIAAVIASRFTTTTANPNLPMLTPVNLNVGEQTGIVVPAIVDPQTGAVSPAP